MGAPLDTKAKPIKAREAALDELWRRGQELGADGVVGIAFDYSPMGTSNDMLMVTATGTAVKLRARD